MVTVAFFVVIRSDLHEVIGWTRPMSGGQDDYVYVNCRPTSQSVDLHVAENPYSGKPSNGRFCQSFGEGREPDCAR
jgi:hypothetical protein